MRPADLERATTSEHVSVMEYMCMCVLSLSALISDSWHQKIFQVTLSYVANQPHCEFLFDLFQFKDPYIYCLLIPLFLSFYTIH